MGWVSAISTIAGLILEIIKVFKRSKDESLAKELKNAKTSKEKQDVAVRIAKRMYVA